MGLPSLSSVCLCWPPSMLVVPSVAPNCLALELGPNHTPLPAVASLSLNSRGVGGNLIAI
jgi:hypothetical protein